MSPSHGARHSYDPWATMDEVLGQMDGRNTASGRSDDRDTALGRSGLVAEPSDGATALLPSPATASSPTASADSAAGMPQRPSWPAGSEYIVCKEYRGVEHTPARDGRETGYLACSSGDRVALMNGVGLPGHAGNDYPWYVYAAKRDRDEPPATRTTCPDWTFLQQVQDDAVSGWIPTVILGARCFGMADELSVPRPPRPPRPAGAIVLGWPEPLVKRWLPVFDGLEPTSDGLGPIGSEATSAGCNVLPPTSGGLGPSGSVPHGLEPTGSALPLLDLAPTTDGLVPAPPDVIRSADAWDAFFYDL